MLYHSYPYIYPHIGYSLYVLVVAGCVGVVYSYACGVITNDAAISYYYTVTVFIYLGSMLWFAILSLLLFG